MAKFESIIITLVYLIAFFHCMAVQWSEIFSEYERRVNLWILIWINVTTTSNLIKKIQQKIQICKITTSINYCGKKVSLYITQEGNEWYRDTYKRAQTLVCTCVCPVYMYCNICHVLEWLMSDCEQPLNILMSACSVHHYFTAHICTFFLRTWHSTPYKSLHCWLHIPFWFRSTLIWLVLALQLRFYISHTLFLEKSSVYVRDEVLQVSGRFKKGQGAWNLLWTHTRIHASTRVHTHAHTYICWHMTSLSPALSPHNSTYVRL
jgi:hypothetical protein